jgi:hypothetical protein
MAPANQAEADLVREQVENEAEREAQAIGRAIHRYQALADEFSSWLARYLEQRKRHAETRLKMSAQQARQWVGLATNRLVNCKDLRDVSVLLNDWQAQRWKDFKEVLNDG